MPLRRRVGGGHIREKSKYLDNISVLPTSIFISDKFVDGAQPEVAGEDVRVCPCGKTEKNIVIFHC
jgi:hypothetical protein